MNSSSSGPAQKKNEQGLFRVLKGPLLIFLFVLYFYFLSNKIDEVPIPGQLGPAFWPKMILILLMASCGIKAVELILARKRPSEGGAEEPPPAVHYPKLLGMIALLVAVVAAMEVIGFLLANLVFLALFLCLTGVRKKLPLFLYSVLGTVSLLYLFVKVVYLPLPKGNWFFEDLTIYLYRLLHVI
jgi:hypothetical protein